MDTKLTVLAACGLALATTLATVAACTTASPAPAGPPATPAVTTPALRSLNPSPPRPDQRAAFLAALDRDHVPHSTSGDPEVLIGVGVCGQIQRGRTVEAIAGQLSSSIGWTLEQATSAVNDARVTLC